MSDRPARVAAVVLAGGSGTRLGSYRNKVYLDLAGRPMLAWSLATLDAHPDVGSIIVAVRPGDETTFHDACRGLDLSTPVHSVIGGTSRSGSELAAFELLRPTVEAGGLDLVLVHDGARPFASVELVDRVIAAARTRGGAIPGLEPDQPLFQLDESRGRADQLPSSTVRRVQTPQGFDARRLIEAYHRAAAEGFEGVDTSEVVARFSGVDAAVVPGEPDNIKVTTPADLTLAHQIAERYAS
jgi:2-C-methyl-D-erythritol 4-phosphate cytidylyltransferase